MYYITKSTHGKSPDTLVYCIWNHNWKLVHEVELTPDRAKEIARKKSKITAVSWMQVLSQSDETMRTGIYAAEVKTMKELKGN